MYGSAMGMCVYVCVCVPTQDMETIDALIDAIKSFKGAVLAVSHDQFFLSKSVQSYWAMGPSGHVKVRE